MYHIFFTHSSFNGHLGCFPIRNLLELHNIANPKGPFGTSLVVQWLRIHVPMQGTRIRSLVQEDPTCHGATKPVRHNH